MNNTCKYRFTIIVPVYNEEDNMERLKKQLEKSISNTDFSTCVLFVDDGSKDRSLQLIQDMCNKSEHFFYISLLRNMGLSGALKAGIDCVCSEFVGYIDADLQTSPDDFGLLLEEIENYDLVMGIRANRNDSFGKKMQSKFANAFRRMMTHDGVEDTGCPLKVIHTDIAKKIPLFKGMHRFLPALVLLEDGKIKQIPVRHYPRLAGKSKYNLSNRLIAPFIDCFVYRWMKSRYSRYIINKDNLI